VHSQAEACATILPNPSARDVESSRSNSVPDYVPLEATITSLNTAVESVVSCIIGN
jgi:hypothetical protein